MVFSMATRKITVTLPVEQVSGIRDLVGQGRASSVSGFVKHAVGVALLDATAWGETLEAALRQTGGPLTDAERNWADRALSAERSPRSRKRKAA
jgi:Arc/MetJ-type ribon-helix-helix transcriptional regulator